ncbi:MAG: purine-nucleoside phosphorylase [Erysipelotrichaceae bacterium]
MNNFKGTAHNKAGLNEIADVVLMPGDPLRAKFIADTFLNDVVEFNTVRNMFGYTGTYQGHKISVMGSGMGMPSIGIYSYELFKFYDVKAIVRIGSAGAYTEKAKLYDVVLASSAYSQSTYAKVQNGYSEEFTYPSEVLNEKILDIAKDLKIPVHHSPIHSSDVFYNDSEKSALDLYDEKGCLCVEMESFALFHNAKVLGKKAACLLTISDNLVTKEETSADERQTAFTNMMKIALELAKGDI